MGIGTQTKKPSPFWEAGFLLDSVGSAFDDRSADGDSFSLQGVVGADGTGSLVPDCLDGVIHQHLGAAVDDLALALVVDGFAHRQSVDQHRLDGAHTIGVCVVVQPDLDPLSRREAVILVCFLVAGAAVALGAFDQRGVAEGKLFLGVVEAVFALAGNPTFKVQIVQRDAFQGSQTVGVDGASGHLGVDGDGGDLGTALHISSLAGVVVQGGEASLGVRQNRQHGSLISSGAHRGFGNGDGDAGHNRLLGSRSQIVAATRSLP